jgi:hypothetical protein
MPEKLPALRLGSISKRKYKMQKVNWLIVGVLSFVIVLILLGTEMLMSDWGIRDWGTMGPIGMMENWEYSSPPSPLGWVGMIFMWLIPVGLFVLAVFGTVWLVRNASHSSPPSS